MAPSASPALLPILLSACAASLLIKPDRGRAWERLRQLLEYGPARLIARKLISAVLLVLLGRAVLQFQAALRRSLALMNPCETELDADLKDRLKANMGPPWGRGLPCSPLPGEWRPYLFSFKDATENLEEIHGMLGITRRRKDELSLEQLTEGVRRVLVLKYGELLRATDRYWSQAQAASIATALAVECRLQMPVQGGLDECVPTGFAALVPWETPAWLQFSQRLSIAALRPWFLHVWSWTSRYVKTPYGLLHVYDSHPQGGSRGPPLLLQHGMFVTGWSMALLAWLLSRRGRRVIVPDLFDRDHGLSASSGALNGGQKVRKFADCAEALLCVLRDLIDNGALEFDLAGHSYGAVLVARLAAICERDGLPLRKVVLLGPGGPLITLSPSPFVARFLNRPMETIAENLPSWLPAAPFQATARCALGVLLNANNVNTLVGPVFSDYLGETSIGSRHSTLLLWGDCDRVACPRSGLGPFLRSRFPDLQAYWLKGGGHNIQVDSAVTVARTMHAWLDPGDSEARQSSLAEAMLFATKASLQKMDLPPSAAGAAASGTSSSL
eukprot:TRINITY_DN82476_c0_g1_i1.p1 TRINITY_DN82476_c0_g1~~TRINITY_DN82476_c0_g1_i1.p1  ORF type:complete len:557 (-),score=60.71 TRINITY_DN82476_c0_g1_i1:41-1711(-)